MKILLAIDGSDCSKRMLAWLATHPEVLGAGARNSYTAVTAVPPVPPHITHHLPQDIIQHWYDTQARAVLDPVIEFARRHEWPLTTQAPVGSAAAAITDEAKAGGYDLVVMGAHGHSALGSLVLGSVTQRVLATSPVPVLVAR